MQCLILEYSFNEQPFKVASDSMCRQMYLQPIFGVSLAECATIHLSGQAVEEAFSYEAFERACYPVVPELPDSFNCSSNKGIYVYRTMYEGGSNGVPTRISTTGNISNKT